MMMGFKVRAGATYCASFARHSFIALDLESGCTEDERISRTVQDDSGVSDRPSAFSTRHLTSASALCHAVGLHYSVRERNSGVCRNMWGLVCRL
jgi:hypothetical protein